jgi:hypothetical protein
MQRDLLLSFIQLCSGMNVSSTGEDGNTLPFPLLQSLHIHSGDIRCQVSFPSTVIKALRTGLRSRRGKGSQDIMHTTVLNGKIPIGQTAVAVLRRFASVPVSESAIRKDSPQEYAGPDY